MSNLLYFEDFNKGQPQEVAVYDYDKVTPSNPDTAVWDRSRVSFDRRPSVVEIRAFTGDKDTDLTVPNADQRIITGGFGLWKSSTAYPGGFAPKAGSSVTIEVKVRSISDPHDRKEVKHVLCTYPAEKDPLGWPHGHEVDFMEDGGGLRQESTFTVHFFDPAAVSATNPSGHRQIQRKVKVDRTKWQVFGFRWSKDLLVCLLNGREYGRIEEKLAIPSVPHTIIAQTEACALTDGTLGDRGNMEIDWIRVTEG